MQADGQALLDQHTAARTPLTRERRVDRLHLLPGACCLESEDGEKRRPACVRDALCKVVVPDHIGRLQLFMIDRVVLLNEGQRRLMVEVLSLATYRLMRLRQQ
jgi:hypothetical protein